MRYYGCVVCVDETDDLDACVFAADAEVAQASRVAQRDRSRGAHDVVPHLPSIWSAWSLGGGFRDQRARVLGCVSRDRPVRSDGVVVLAEKGWGWYEAP